MPFPIAAFLICEKNVFCFFLLKFYACLVENKISNQKNRRNGGGGGGKTQPRQNATRKIKKRGKESREQQSN